MAIADLLEAGIMEEEDPQVLNNMESSLAHLKQADELIDGSKNEIRDLARFIHVNWDEDFEKRLKSAGYQGSLFLLSEYKVHLEDIAQAIPSLVRHRERIVEALKNNDLLGEEEDDAFTVESIHRGICRALIRFLQFDDEASRTGLVLATLAAHEKSMQDK
ncbi:MAG: hypothetical protein H6677_26525 [Candidatus Obscuribacterales bacterium]|nr:hypothetical protein [Cyanobacteria bacterium HKST-UBA01]MCB9471858.1 hypothetical protein [Candidatus Obscuribacterales bacterium]